MATITRQPFAPLDGARLQTLTSLKNRQNAISNPSPVKRKAAESVDTDNFENVDPSISSKRSKATDSFFSTVDSFIKPATFLLTKSTNASDVSIASPSKAASSRPRSVPNPKSPAARLNTSISRSSPLSAPAGRSPTRGKRSGILSSRRRTAGSYSRVDPPVFGLSGSGSSSSPAPFSLDAALKGTIPSYANRNASSSASLNNTSSTATTSSSDFSSLHEPEMKSSWDFEIHEDTHDQEMTNLLQHSTCVLDISSDEESESRRQRERAEGKENVPPADDVSQTSRPRAARHAAHVDDMMIEKERNPLGEMDVKEYYSEGCDENSIILVPGDEDEPQQPQLEHQQQQQQQPQESLVKEDYEFASELKPVESAAPEPVAEEGTKTAEELMGQSNELAPGAAVLEPMEGTGESFEVWESGSAKDEAETAVECS